MVEIQKTAVMNGFQSFVRDNWVRLLILGVLVWLSVQRRVSLELNLVLPPATTPAPASTQPEPYEMTETVQPSALPSSAPPAEQATLSPVPGLPVATDRPPAATALSAGRIQAFVERFGHVAATEEKKFGVPAAIILANGLYQSRAGTSEAVTRGNNYFALPCTSDWKGATISLGGKCYRSYDNAWLSFRDHSKFLAPWAMRLPANDLDGWARVLESEVYHQPGLAERLMELVRTAALQP